MSPGARAMFVLGAGLIYEALTFFISVAIKKDKEQAAKDSRRTKGEENSPTTEHSTVEHYY